MDWSVALEALGGGPGAVSICALAFAAWSFLGWHRQSQADRIADSKEHTQQLMEMSKQVGSVAEAVRVLTREVERNG